MDQRIESLLADVLDEEPDLVTNMARPATNVVAFYDKRGTCEQCIKEGKGAIKWTRLSCRTGLTSKTDASCGRRPTPRVSRTAVEWLTKNANIHGRSAVTRGIPA